MPIGEIIYSLITLTLMALIIFSPIIRKMIKSAEKHSRGESSSQDSIYESVDSHRVVERILADEDPVPQIKFVEPEPLRHKEDDLYGKNISPVERLDKVSVLKRAVIWKEILDKPVGLRE